MDEYRGPVHVSQQIGWEPEHGLRGRLKQVPIRSRFLKAWAYLFKYRRCCSFNVLPSHHNYLSFVTMFFSLVSTTKTASRRAG
jgi:hypothetical protein